MSIIDCSSIMFLNGVNIQALNKTDAVLMQNNPIHLMLPNFSNIVPDPNTRTHTFIAFHLL